MISELNPTTNPKPVGKRYHYEKHIYNERIRLKPHEYREGTSKSSLMPIAIRSRGEVAQMLGISRQAVHQIERIALYKVRMRLAMALGGDVENDELIRSLISLTQSKRQPTCINQKQPSSNMAKSASSSQPTQTIA